MRFVLSLLAVLLLPAIASATPILANTWLKLESHSGGGIAAPYYGLRLDGLGGDDSKEYTFDFSDSRSKVELYYDDSLNTIQIQGDSWGGEDIGSSYAGGGSLYSIEMVYKNVTDLGSYLEVAAPGGTNTGSIEDISAGVTYALVDESGNHNYSFRLADEHRGEGPSGWGWVNHSGEKHVYSSDWLFVVGEPSAPIPEPSAALLFAAGLLAVGRGQRKRVSVS